MSGSYNGPGGSAAGLDTEHSSTLIRADGDLTAMLCARGQVMSLCDSLPYKTAALYALIGRDDAGNDVVRPGETGDVWIRMSRHLCDNALRWFDRALIIHGPRIDKPTAHALQFLLHERVVGARRCRLGSRADANPPDDDALDNAWRLFDRLSCLLTELGLDALAGSGAPEKNERLWLFEHHAYKAALAEIDGEMHILAGSQIRARPVQSARPSDRRIREELLAHGLAEPTPRRPGRMTIHCDVRVASLDAGGKLVLGNRRAMRRAWREVVEPSPRFVL